MHCTGARAQFPLLVACSFLDRTPRFVRARQPRLVFLDRLGMLRLTLYSEQCASSPVAAFSSHDCRRSLTPIARLCLIELRIDECVYLTKN